MTDTQEIVDARAVLPNAAGVDMATFTPHSMAELTRFAQFVARSGWWKSGDRPYTQDQVCLIILSGYEIGLTPLQALNHLLSIKGKPPAPDAQITTGLILRSGLATTWRVDDATPGIVSITFQRRGMAEPDTVTADQSKIPQHMLGEQSNYLKHPQDMLYAYAVRRVARRHFADVLTGLTLDAPEPDEVIDVAAVEAKVGRDHGDCPRCGAQLILRANPNGGAFLACRASDCGYTEAPPAAVRDEIRGGAALHLEAGEREVTPADLEAVEPAPAAEPEPPGPPPVRPEPTPGTDFTPERVEAMLGDLRWARGQQPAVFRLFLERYHYMSECDERKERGETPPTITEWLAAFDSVEIGRMRTALRVAVQEQQIKEMQP